MFGGDGKDLDLDIKDVELNDSTDIIELDEFVYDKDILNKELVFYGIKNLKERKIKGKMVKMYIVKAINPDTKDNVLIITNHSWVKLLYRYISQGNRIRGKIIYSDKDKRYFLKGV